MTTPDPEEMLAVLRAIAEVKRYHKRRGNGSICDTPTSVTLNVSGQLIERLDRVLGLDPCAVDKYSSRVCEKGTRSCVKEHSAEVNNPCADKQLKQP